MNTNMNTGLPLQPEMQEFKNYLVGTRFLNESTSRRYANLIQRSLWALNSSKEEATIKDIEAAAPNFSKDLNVCKSALEKFCQYVATHHIQSIRTTSKPAMNQSVDPISVGSLVFLREENKKLKETLKALKELVNELVPESDD